MSEKVIILLATYNGAKYIKEQVDSILKQEYEDWTLYICDDGSSDDTVRIINDYSSAYKEKIKIIDGKRFGNARDNFLHLLACCTGDYFMFCDQDDVWDSAKVSETLKVMKTVEGEKGKSEPIMIFSDLKVVDEKMNTINDSFAKYQGINPKRTNFNELIIQNVVTGCTVMINDELKSLVLQYNNSTKILMHDWWIALVASKFGTIRYINKQLINYRQHSSNSVGAKNVNSLKYYFEKIKNVNKIRKSLEMTRLQAKEFLNVYRDILSEEDVQAITRYVEIMNFNKFKRIHFYRKNKILKSKFIQNIGLFLWG